MIGIDPAPFTLRELLEMADGRARLDWSQTALLAALIYNPHRRPNSPAKGPEEFDPFSLREKEGKGIDFLELKKAVKAMSKRGKRGNAGPESQGTVFRPSGGS